MATPAGAQTQQQSLWVASFNTVGITGRISLHFDAQVRSTDDARNVQTILVRPGLNYHLTRRTSTTVGYAWIPNRRAIDGATGLLAEHRLWVQALHGHRLGRAAIGHRLRFEQRYIPTPVADGGEVAADGFADAQRLRYFVRGLLPLTHAPTFERGGFVALQDEVFANVGDKSAVNGKVFDQNRLYAAVGYRLPPRIDVEIGYMYQLVEGRSSAVRNHILQLAVYKGL